MFIPYDRHATKSVFRHDLHYAMFMTIWDSPLMTFKEALENIGITGTPDISFCCAAATNYPLSKTLEPIQLLCYDKCPLKSVAGIRPCIMMKRISNMQELARDMLDAENTDMFNACTAAIKCMAYSLANVELRSDATELYEVVE